MRPPAPDDACVDPLAPVPPTLDAIKLSVALSAARLEARRARADATAARAEAAALASRLDAAVRAAASADEFFLKNIFSSSCCPNARI